ncbi:hypothetical protein SteCoe_8300 [Stentor coeruleus]|uniref:Uncharacterized protein n=1 Tax=Stentor coeruleus TaxID=5963 RepID=A0A1R2CKF6_9CILI|nr:hypothetical protein SteCoe_8300 [Stentor coeruleus]
MSLFSNLEATFESDIKSWTDEVHHRINLKAHQQSEQYNYDFYQEEAFHKPGKYVWEIKNSNKFEIKSSLAKASISTWVTEEPSDFPYEEIPNIFQENLILFSIQKSKQ